MKIFNVIIAAFVAVALASCGTSSSVGGFTPYESERYSQMADLVCLGEVEVSVEYSTYLGGLFSNIHTVNGKEYDALSQERLEVHSGNLLKSVTKGGDGKLNRAYYKAYEKYPNAVYYQVVRTKKESEHLFLGNTIKRTATVRAYGFKK